MQKRPITVLARLLTSGKTTLLNRILNNRDGRCIAVRVNDVSDAQLVHEGGTQLGRTEEKLVASRFLDPFPRRQHDLEDEQERTLETER
jgi:hypothetical protein